MAPVTLSRAREVSESWPNSGRVASVKNRGRSPGLGTKRGEQGADRQWPWPPGLARERGLDDRGGAAVVDKFGGERGGLITGERGGLGDVQPAAL